MTSKVIQAKTFGRQNTKSGSHAVKNSSTVLT